VGYTSGDFSHALGSSVCIFLVIDKMIVRFKLKKLHLDIYKEHQIDVIQKFGTILFPIYFRKKKRLIKRNRYGIEEI